MKPIYAAIAGLLFSALLGACSSLQVLNAMAPQSGYRPTLDVTFDPAHDLKLDVYTPDGARDAPVVVFFHGGRWESEDKKDYQFVGATLAQQGFVTVIPNYRLYPQVRYPAFVDDSARAVAWVHAHIGSYGGSPEKIVVMGYASGAYNAAMLALNPAFMKKAGGNRDWIRGMIGIAGPYDILPIIDPDLRDIFGPPERFAQTQPVFWVDGHNPPLLLMASQADHVVSVNSTLELYDRVAKANGPVEKVIYPDLSHQKIIAVLSTALSGQADVLFNVVHFVRRVTAGAVAPPVSGSSPQPPGEGGPVAFPLSPRSS